jgi:hypothetical protein
MPLGDSVSAGSSSGAIAVCRKTAEPMTFWRPAPPSLNAWLSKST